MTNNTSDLEVNYIFDSSEIQVISRQCRKNPVYIEIRFPLEHIEDGIIKQIEIFNSKINFRKF